MIRWLCVILVLAIITVSAFEFAFHKTPLEQVMDLAGGKGLGAGSDAGKTVIRIGVSSWQMDEFPWQKTIDAYMADHPDVSIKLSTLESPSSTMLLFWHYGLTEFDVIVAWADFEITPFIEYNWNSPDPARRSLIVNINDYLTEEQVQRFVPAIFAGCQRKDPQTGEMKRYELPWMGEVLALNFNKKFFAQHGLTPPEDWTQVEQACLQLADLKYVNPTDGKAMAVAPLAMNFSQSAFFAQNCYVPMLAAFKKGRGIGDEHGQLDITSPEAVEVFKTLKRWYQAGYISRNCLDFQAIEQDLRVMRAAMYPHWQSRGLWAVKDHGSETIGISPTPGATSDSAGSLIATYGCIIPKCSPVIRRAVEFCYETFSTDGYGFQTAVAHGFIDPATGKIKGGGKMPVLRDSYDPQKTPNMVPEIMALRPALEKGYTYPDPRNWNPVARIVVVEFQKFLSGDTPTAEEALAKAKQRVDEEVYSR